MVTHSNRSVDKCKHKPVHDEHEPDLSSKYIPDEHETVPFIYDSVLEGASVDLPFAALKAITVTSRQSRE